MPWSLSAQQEDFEKRLRTVSLGMCAIGVLVYLLILLRQAILPLLLALALKHLLEPLVELLSVRPIVCCGRAFLGKPSTCKQQLQRGHRLQTGHAGPEDHHPCRLNGSRCCHQHGEVAVQGGRSQQHRFVSSDVGLRRKSIRRLGSTDPGQELQGHGRKAAALEICREPSVVVWRKQTNHKGTLAKTSQAHLRRTLNA